MNPFIPLFIIMAVIVIIIEYLEDKWYIDPYPISRKEKEQ